MAKLSIKPGSTGEILYIFIQDSSVTTGAGLTGLVYNSSGLTAYYVRPGGSATAITLATQTVTGSFSSGGFVEVDSTNMPGLYRFDIPDAVNATGVRSGIVMLQGATNMAPVILEIDLHSEVDTTHLSGTAQTARDIGASVLLSSGTGTGQISLASGAVTAGTVSDKTGYSISGTKTTLDALNDITSAQAATSVWSATITEPTGIFAWTGSTKDILQWLGILSRNKMTQTSTTQTLRNDGDTANVATSTVSDDGTTFTRSEWI